MLIENFPKSIEYDGGIFFLRMHITAWDKICLCYREEFNAKRERYEMRTILSQVVEPKMEKEPTFSSCVNDIVDVRTFDEGVDMLDKRLNDAVEKGVVTVYHK